MISISKDELLGLAKDHGGALVGGNISAKVDGYSVWLATSSEGVFAITEEGKKFVEKMTAKPAAKPPKKAASKPQAPAPVVEPVNEGDDEDLLEGL